MKAISLWQPWATLVAIGAKAIETRGWQTPYRGPLAIHAAVRWTPQQTALCRTEPFVSVLRAAGYDADPRPNTTISQHSIMLGHIVAIATLAGIVPTENISFAPLPLLPEQNRHPHEKEFGDYSPGRFGWFLKDVRPLRVPMPYRGRQGLFNVTGLCRVCGCWQECACDGGCSWIENDLCSKCVNKQPNPPAADKSTTADKPPTQRNPTHANLPSP